MYVRLIKPFFDRIFAVIGFLILSPIFIFCTLFLFLANHGSPFFFQKRPGKNEKIFTIIKFKTMNDKKDSEGNLLSDSERLTTVGKFIRKTSLDEIPQLLNVIVGDMSFVGPRPLLPRYLPLYNSFQKQRHHVKPGITGWAQVNGRNAISWDEKFEKDIYYVNNCSFLLDCKIILKTFAKVFKSEGITDAKTETVSYFEGNE
ncbi:MAG: sugar transferase [Flavobacteriaceae bacterium]|nr:sugar transferase [Flavobacteriaceae bacterium]